MDETPTTTTPATGFGDRLRSLATSPYLWGGLATYGFYQAIPHLPVYRELAERYFCAHPVEYVQTALFFIGLFILVRKLLGLRSQRAAVRACVLEAASAAPFPSSASDASAAGSPALRAVAAGSVLLAGRLRQTPLAERLNAIARFLQHRPGAEGIETELKDLEQRAGDELHDSYALVQTINWAIPIMGFLGTVLGITMAIANLDVNQLDSSLSAVTFNLAVAFDTTAVALCHSLILVFLYLFVKRSEEAALAQVADFCRRHVLPLVPATPTHPSPFLDAESAAARQLVERTGELIETQTKLWTDSVEALRERWTTTLDSQQQSLTLALQDGTQSTLGEHAEHLAELRGEFLRALEHVTRQRTEAEAALRAQEAALIARWEAGTQRLATVLSAAQQSAEDRHTRLISDLAAQVDRWQAQLESTTSALAAPVERLAKTEELLGSLLDRGGNILSLEQSLTENLQALRAADTFEQTMHSLSAAVHLLTAHARQRAA